jgi:DNA-binding IclR family transcriptional regulator
VKDKESNIETVKKYAAPALEKGLDIIELLAKEPEGLKLKDIALSLKKSVSEVFRMVLVLERRTYLKFDAESDRYSLSMKLFEIAHQHVPVQKLVKAASIEMEKLAKSIDQSCHLTINSNNNALVVVQKDSPMDKLITIRLGAKAPLLNSCSGHIFISFSKPAEQLQLCEFLLKQTTKKELNNIIEVVQNQGYERMLSKQIQGVEDIGFPVYGYDNELVACLVVPYLHYIGDLNTVNINSAIAATRQTATNISQKLGARL